MSTIDSPSKSATILQSIRSMIVLYGSVRSTRLARRIDRSLLDLPLNTGTIVTHHLANAGACAKRFGLKDFEMRVLVDTSSRAPKMHDDGAGVEGVRLVIQQDASPIRGVAGVLADATKDMDDGEYIIVTSGAQIYLESLSDLVYAMAKKEADVSFVTSNDGAPVGVWLIRCGVLKSIKSIGYVDLKEQALDQWKHEHKVCVVERPRAYTHSTRSRVEYISAILAEGDGFGAGKTIDEDPYREDWESSFSIVEPGATVGDGVVLHDSVVLNGATIGKGAVIVRSVICASGHVAPGARVTDRVLTESVKKVRGR
jgi:hypothetical protein